MFRPLTLITAFSISLSAWSASASDLWVGRGTRLDPYIIVDAVDIESLADAVNGGETFAGRHFRLAGDIDMSAAPGFNGIGTAEALEIDSHSFCGEFNGMQYTISGLSIDSSGAAVGLFNSLGEGADVHHLRFDATCTVRGENCVGMAAGRMWGGRVEYIANDGTVSATKTAGGIAGDLRGGVIQSCANHAAVEAVQQVAGIAGQLRGTASVTGCYNTGAVSATAPGACAGIVAVAFDNTTISACYNAGTIHGRYSKEWECGPSAILSDRPAVLWQGSVDGCYYVSPESYATDDLATPLTKSQFTSAEGVALLNAAVATALGGTTDSHADATFRISKGINGGYPHLEWETHPSGAAISDVTADAAVSIAVHGNRVSRTDGRPLRVYTPRGILVARGSEVTLTPGLYIADGYKLSIR